jgi:flavin reductase (DIM6/NTAB) family NADH-FMN oxidoreductase RutF
MSFTEISAESLQENPFHLIGREWMLITAENEGKIATMTASWGGLGVMWNKNVAFIALRPQRYTKEFVDASNHLSLSFFEEKHRKNLAYCGRVSGRDEDKVAHCGFTVVHEKGTPYFEEARLVLICRKMFAQPYKAENFIDPEIMDCYEKKDYHTLYIVEIEKILVK